MPDLISRWTVCSSLNLSFFHACPVLRPGTFLRVLITTLGGPLLFTVVSRGTCPSSGIHKQLQNRSYASLKSKYKGEKNVIGFEVWKTEFMHLKVKSVLQNMGFAFTLCSHPSLRLLPTGWHRWFISFLNDSLDLSVNWGHK